LKLSKFQYLARKVYRGFHIISIRNEGKPHFYFYPYKKKGIPTIIYCGVNVFKNDFKVASIIEDNVFSSNENITGSGNILFFSFIMRELSPLTHNAMEIQHGCAHEKVFCNCL
jgi:hypothetical protein